MGRGERSGEMDKRGLMPGIFLRGGTLSGKTPMPPGRSAKKGTNRERQGIKRDCGRAGTAGTKENSIYKGQ